MRKEQAMTTVINFNFLNVIRLRQDNITINNDVHSYAQYPGSRTHDLNACDRPEDVIDITPHKPAIISTQHFPRTGMLKAISFAGASRVDSIYNRSGKAVQCFDAKGLLVDLYV